MKNNNLDIFVYLFGYPVQKRNNFCGNLKIRAKVSGHFQFINNIFYQG